VQDCDLEAKFVRLPGGEEIRTVRATVGQDAGYLSRTPIVLLHGMGAGVGMWCKNFGPLARQRPVYAVDLLGFGRSSRVAFPANPELCESAFVRSIEEWRKAEGLNEVILLGHSFGGYLAFNYALRHPNSVRKLILADPWGLLERPDNHQPSRRWISVVGNLLHRFDPLAVVRARLARRRGRDGGGGHKSGVVERAHDILDYIYHCNAQPASGETGFRYLAALGFAKRPLYPRLPQLEPRLPVSLIYGGRSWLFRYGRPADAPDLAEEFRERLGPRRGPVTVRCMRNCNHHLYAEDFNQFNKLVQDESQGPAAPSLRHRHSRLRPQQRVPFPLDAAACEAPICRFHRAVAAGRGLPEGLLVVGTASAATWRSATQPSIRLRWRTCCSRDPWGMLPPPPGYEPPPLLPPDRVGHGLLAAGPARPPALRRPIRSAGLVRRLRGDLRNFFDDDGDGSSGWLGDKSSGDEVLDYVYHCNAQVRPCLSRIDQLPAQLPLTVLYGGQSRLYRLERARGEPNIGEKLAVGEASRQHAGWRSPRAAGELYFYFSGPCQELYFYFSGPCQELYFYFSGPCQELYFYFSGPCQELSCSFYFRRIQVASTVLEQPQSLAGRCYNELLFSSGSACSAAPPPITVLTARPSDRMAFSSPSASAASSSAASAAALLLPADPHSASTAANSTSSNAKVRVTPSVRVPTPPSRLTRALGEITGFSDCCIVAKVSRTTVTMAMPSSEADLASVQLPSAPSAKKSSSNLASSVAMAIPFALLRISVTGFIQRSWEPPAGASRCSTAPPGHERLSSLHGGHHQA
uniref:AB hydrolase-1 domain-containing protein n=1 Tax=Macrostomum lignano TaxID=282301 RepID=A0A1I8FBL0_9PLAT